MTAIGCFLQIRVKLTIGTTTIVPIIKLTQQRGQLMLQHAIQRYLDSENIEKRSKGMCAFLDLALVVSDDKRAMALREHEINLHHVATLAWCESTAVPSSQCEVFPVKHPVKELAATAYWDAEDNEEMLTGEYGENRTQYAEFVRDYAEEYWK